MSTKLNGVAETLLITVKARAEESLRTNGLLHDPYAVALLEKLNEEGIRGIEEVYRPSQIGTVIRTVLLDELTAHFSARHHEALIVNLGCGLDARRSRLQLKNIHWYDIDLPEVIKLRKRFFQEEHRYTLIPCSMLNEKWLTEIPSHLPTLILAEGVTMYFEGAQLKALADAVLRHFKQVEAAFDVVSPWVAKHTSNHPDVSKYDASFKWGLKSAKALEKKIPQLEILSERSFMLQQALSRWPLYMRPFRHFNFVKNMCRIIHCRKRSFS